MITYVKNISYSCPEKLFLENIISKFNINTIDEIISKHETCQLGEYLNSMPKTGLNISISNAELFYVSRQMGACRDKNIWVYYPNSDDFADSLFYDKIDFKKWRDKISENLILHEIEHVDFEKINEDFKEEHHCLENKNNCVSIVKTLSFSTFVENLDSIYESELCLSCEKKIISQLSNYSH
jgi:hypothetical protein